MVPYISECANLGVEVLPPHVNHSAENFTVEDGKVRFGLLAVKNVSGVFIKAIINEREKNGPFASFFTFCRRVYGKEFNRRSVEHFIKCGALDGLGTNRRQMLQMMDPIISSLEDDRKHKIDGQIGLFDVGSAFEEVAEPPIPDVPELPDREKLALEKLTTGLYISGHPMAEYRDMAKKLRCARIDNLLEADPQDPSSYRDGAKVDVLVILSSVKKKITKNDTTMAFLEAEDMYGSIEVIVFPKAYTQYAPFIAEDAIVLIKARLSVRDDEAPKLLLESIEPAPSLGGFQKHMAAPKPEYQTISYIENAASPAPGSRTDNTAAQPAKASDPGKKRAHGLFLRFASENDDTKQQALSRITAFSGNTPVYFYFTDSKKYDLKTGLRVGVSAPLLSSLKQLLGDKNVVLQ